MISRNVGSREREREKRAKQAEVEKILTTKLTFGSHARAPELPPRAWIEVYRAWMKESEKGEKGRRDPSDVEPALGPFFVLLPSL